MLSSLAVLNCVFYAVYSACKWEVTRLGGDNKILDLTCAASRTLTTSDSANHDYSFTLCRNGASCNNEDVMVAQTSTADCFILGRWDQDTQPTYSADNGGQFKFEYYGSNDCGNPARTWAPTFQCEAGTEFRVETVTEQPGSCYYAVNIYTKYACDGNTECSSGGGSSSKSGDGSLSGGWIFIIVFFGGFLLYFIVGYIVMGTTKNKQGGLGDFGNNIPNKALWVACPSLVIAGCAVTKEAIMGMINKDKGGGGLDEPIGNDAE